MKVHILSDLHCEFSKYQIQVRNADIIVLGGDISIGTRGIDFAKELLRETRSHILYVMGNHEPYGGNIDTIRRQLRELCEPEDRLFFLDNDLVIINGVRFLGATLWTDFRLFGESKRLECLAEARWLNDFRLIRTGNGDIFRPRDSAELHEQSLEWLTKRLDQQYDGKTVVITHHLPSFNSISERYRDDLLSACFSSNLDFLFGKMDLWVHGHTHNSMDYVKAGTRVVCNPRGYNRYDGDVENIDFDPMLVIEV